MAHEQDFFIAAMSSCALGRLANAGLKLEERRVVGKPEERLDGTRVTAKYVRSIVVHCMSAGTIALGGPTPFRLFFVNEMGNPDTEIKGTGNIMVTIGYQGKLPSSDLAPLAAVA